MKRIFQRRWFHVVAAFFLAGLILVTLPVSQTRWREVLGVVADVDTIENPTITTLVPTLTPVGSPTPIAPTTVSGQTAMPEASATPLIIGPSPTSAPPVEPAPTELPPTVAQPTDEPPVETTTEPSN